MPDRKSNSHSSGFGRLAEIERELDQKKESVPQPVKPRSDQDKR
jgi:hypothetical protein